MDRAEARDRNTHGSQTERENQVFHCSCPHTPGSKSLSGGFEFAPQQQQESLVIDHDTDQTSVLFNNPIGRADTYEPALRHNVSSETQKALTWPKVPALGEARPAGKCPAASVYRS